MRVNNTLSMLSTLVLSVSCLNNSVSPYCSGLHETNVPPQVVIVESAANAVRYVAHARDSRDHPSEDFGRWTVHEGVLSSNLPSCGNVDNFDAIEHIQFEQVERVMQTMPEGAQYCTALPFDAATNVSVIQLRQDQASWTADYPLRAYISTAPAALGSKAYSYVAISARDQPAGTNWGQNPTPRERLYQQDTPDGAPPVIVARAWHFENSAETEALREPFGLTSEEPWIRCADIYFAYFAQ